MANIRCDAAVIGAGVIGMSTAYELCKRKKKVILIDKSVIGAGASGACDDMILLQSKKPGILLEMAFRSLELFKALKVELPCDIEFESRGGTILIENQAQLSEMEEFVKSQNKYGLEVEIIDAKELRELQPFVSPNIIASTYSKQDSQANPMALMKALYLASKKLGLEYKSMARPIEISNQLGHWKIKLNNDDEVEADIVINATGAWANEVNALIGIDLPIAPRKGQVIVTEAIPNIGKTNVWSAQYIVSKLKSNHSKEGKTLAEKYGLGFAFTGTRNGNYLIGSTRENVGFDRTTDPEALALLANQVTHFFPVMKKINFIRSFAGLRPSTPDGMPFLGEIREAPGFFIAAGHEGDGIALSPVTGVLMADIVEGKNPEFSIAEFSPSRFSTNALGAKS
ncbi:MAG: Hydrogen cyanide synthase subunit HcnC precursor [Spirochaetes bacterium ADurb.Bin110]|jgi:sarcosine oxidase subunit beta|nr:MAG: Hydrogen cyanide synthase subunit HcnC precursor [Spirochaetes bacterium ADurb.Bin110]